MQFEQEVLPGTWVVRLKRFADARGTFVKTFARSVFDAHGAGFDLREEFYSLSRRDVIRGMHFQLPPHDHAKLVYCAAGAVEDVLLDLRRGPGYGRVASVALSGDAPALVFIPSGIAHGFRSLADDSLMVYKTSTEHAPTHDAGIRWDSFGHDWHCAAPVLSDRDRGHPPLAAFDSPFAS
jgi:dTDP-4-dehydrorhamnose 3,5-epimerase